MVKPRILSLEDKEEWTKFIMLLPTDQQDIYYTPEYYSLYENYGDGKARCFVFEKDGALALYPFLLNSVNDLGYDLDDEYFDIQGAYGYNGVVSSNNSEEFISSFYENFHKYCKDHKIIVEFTRFHPLLKNYEFSKHHLNLIFNRKTVFIDLSKTEETVFSEFQRTTKKQIRRCYSRFGIKVEKKENDISDLDIFLKIYWETMARLNSVKYLRFNRDYFKELFLMKDTIQFVAYYNNNIIASIVAINGPSYMHGHLGGASANYLNLSAYSLLYWEMIKTGKEKGKRYLHIGGSATSAIEDKLLVFKKHFSHDLSDFYIGKKIHYKEIYEDVVKQWKQKFPESYNNHKNKIIGYREIKNEHQRPTDR